MGATIRTILPRSAVRGEIAAGELVVHMIADPPVSRELILAHAPQRASAAATRIVARLIRQNVETMIRAGR